jgi:DNA-binding transcriptional MerR regulator
VAKGPDAFRTISEAADELNVPQHVLRFWETKFSFIRPMKRAGGRRFYRPQDIAVLRGVRSLLHDAGYTIKGVQKLHKEQGLKRLIAAADGEAAPRSGGLALEFANGDLTEEGRERLHFALDSLQTAKRRLDSLLGKA